MVRFSKVGFYTDHGVVIYAVFRFLESFYRFFVSNSTHKAVIGEVMNPLQKRSGEVRVKLIISLNPILDTTLLGVDDDMGHMNEKPTWNLNHGLLEREIPIVKIIIFRFRVPFFGGKHFCPNYLKHLLMDLDCGNFPVNDDAVRHSLPKIFLDLYGCFQK